MDLIIYHGPVMASKSLQLIRSFDFAQARGVNPLVMKPMVDTRDGMRIMSRSCIECVEAEKFSPEKFAEYTIIDEAQWVTGLIEYIKRAPRQGTKRIELGIIDRDFRGEYFPTFFDLFAQFEKIRLDLDVHTAFIPLYAKCVKCDKLANMTNRIKANGMPAHYNEDVNIPGHNYTPVCQDHHVVLGGKISAQSNALYQRLIQKEISHATYFDLH